MEVSEEIYLCSSRHPGWLSKTSFLPWWLWREIQQLGRGDYIAATSSYDLFKLKFLPEMRQVFEHILKIGRYWAGEKILEIKNLETGKFEAKRTDDPMWARIILRSAQSKGGLESATAKAAVLDEIGQDEFTLEHWEAILRRLSLSRGRVCGATTLYNLGWLKSEIYEPWTNGSKEIDVIQFQSTINPAFPQEEFDRAKSRMQSWRFSMFYLGEFARPIGLIYGDFTNDMLCDPFFIPDDWSRIIGVDFGGANTATLHIAEDPASDRWYVYRETHEGGKSTKAHVDTQKSYLKDVEDYELVGGAKSEGQQRMDWDEAGLFVEEPSISDVEGGIDRVTELIAGDRLRVFRGLNGLRDELGSYSRKLDPMGNPTDEIKDKRFYHRCLVTGTLVKTSQGNKPIEEIEAGHYVLTRTGYKRVREISKTEDQEIMRADFSDGKVLVGTPDHPVFIKSKGHTPLRALRYGGIIETSYKYEEMFLWQKNLLNFKESNSIVIPTRTIDQMQSILGGFIMVLLNTCIGLFGNTIKVQSQKVVIFTIGIMILAITQLRTLSVFCQKNMQIDMHQRRGEGRIANGQTMLGSLHRSGIDRRRAENGIGLLVNSLGKARGQLRLLVKTALRTLQHWQGMVKLGSALMYANPLFVGQVVLTMREESVRDVKRNSLPINIATLGVAPVSVSGLSDAGRKTVYNLSVEGENEYFANDILVHNCDALRYAAIQIVEGSGIAVGMGYQKLG